MAKSNAILSLERCRKISSKMKEVIRPYVTTSSRYSNGKMWGLRKPDGLRKISRKADGCSFGADEKGFFVYTQRCRSKSHVNPLQITKKEIDFIESTG